MVFNRQSGTCQAACSVLVVTMLRLGCRCSPLFLTTVLPSTLWLLRHVPAHQLPLATSLAVLPSSGPARQAITGHSAVLAAQPAWQLPTRPASAVRRLQIDLRVPLPQVK
jgi:hypothetical protein